MIDNAFDMIVKPVIHFLEKHSPFIMGVIINVSLSNTVIITPCVVIRLKNDELVSWHKTGRHFPQIAEVLKQIDV